MRSKALLLAAAVLLCAFAFACKGGTGDVSDGEDTTDAEVSDMESSGPVSEAEIKRVVLELGGEKYEVEVNTVPAGDCVRIYNYEYGEITSEKDVDFVELAVRDRTVVYVGKPGERLIIMPDTYIISFCGEYAAHGENVKAGEKAIIKTGKVETLYADYAVIGAKTCRITGRDCERDKRSVILYTPSFGESTRTSAGGVEFVIEDGKITGVYEEGDTDIPENGFVLSFGPNASKPDQSETGAEIHLQNGKYEETVLSVDRYNDVRQQDFLVIYSGKSTTGTNPYGYEVQVDKNLMCVGEVYGGNAAIPEGGFVISGHGKNETALKEAYSHGAYAFLDRKNGTVTIIQTPLTEYVSQKLMLTEADNALRSARAEFLDIDYAVCDELFRRACDLRYEAMQRMAAEEYYAVLELVSAEKAALGELRYRLIPSKAAENRAAWYRSTEKSDEEVRALLQKAKAMNINALYIETWYYGYTIGYSSVPGVLHNPANGEYDALEGFCRIAKEYGIEIHAWVQNFCIGLTQNLAKEPNCLANTLPKEKRLIDRAGNDYYPLPTGGFVFLDPYDAENRALVLAVYEELLENYDIAGIHLDYIRFPELNGENDYGYNDDIVNAFKAQSGYTGDLRRVSKESAVYKEFSGFRREIITSFVGEVYELVMRVKPQTWISVAAYPDMKNAKNTIFQDVAAWVENGWIDEVFSMTYSSDNSYVLSKAKSFVKTIGDKCFYSTGLDGYSGTAPQVLVNQFAVSREAGASGESLFALTCKNSESWLRNSERYTRALKLGAYSRPAVQTYKLNETLAAQIDDFFRKRDALYGEAYAFSGIFDAPLAELREKCASFGGESFAEKLAFAEEAYETLLKTDYQFRISDMESGPCTEAVTNDLAQMRSCLARMINRLKARVGD
ncbi:MAG: family 10 glycosylhydrolase [Clostridia bacterium]|nr:family 10 glycosylhydrolase [Clostridia bacterium]